MLDAEVLDTTNKILETVVTKLWPHEPPKKLYHYAALEKLQKIFEFDDLRLSHAEYSNDQGELAQAKTVIRACTHKSRLLGSRWLPQTTCANRAAGSSGRFLPPSPPGEKTAAR